MKRERDGEGKGDIDVVVGRLDEEPDAFILFLSHFGTSADCTIFLQSVFVGRAEVWSQ